MSNSELCLRPHHLICLHYYQGKGYSPEFCENMTGIKARTAENPTVRLISGADFVCKACPKNDGGLCRDIEKVNRYDALTLSLIGIEIGEQMKWSALADLVRGEILERGLRESICGDCCWSEYCK